MLGDLDDLLSKSPLMSDVKANGGDRRRESGGGEGGSGGDGSGLPTARAYWHLHQHGTGQQNVSAQAPCCSRPLRLFAE